MSSNSSLVNERLNAVNHKIIEMLEKGEYEMLQRNGQRILSIKDWDSPVPDKDCEVFVGSIPRDCFEDELLPFMRSVGDVYEMRLMMDFSGLNRGFAFVKYVDPALVEIATKELNNCEIRPGQRLGVVRAVNKSRLLISSLPESLTLSDIKNVVTSLTEGVSGVEAAINTESRQHGYALYAVVEYVDHRRAALARKKLIPPNIHMWGKYVSVNWATFEDEDTNCQKNDKQKILINRKSPSKKQLFKTAPDVELLRNQVSESQVPMPASVSPLRYAVPLTKPIYSTYEGMRYQQVANNVMHLLASNNGSLVPKSAVLHSVLSAFTCGGSNQGNLQNLSPEDAQINSPANSLARRPICYHGGSYPDQEEITKAQTDYYKQYLLQLKKIGYIHPNSLTNQHGNIQELPYYFRQHLPAKPNVNLNNLLSEKAAALNSVENFPPINAFMRPILRQSETGTDMRLFDLERSSMNVMRERNPEENDILQSMQRSGDVAFIPGVMKNSPQKHFEENIFSRESSPPHTQEHCIFPARTQSLSPSRNLTTVHGSVIGASQTPANILSPGHSLSPVTHCLSPYHSLSPSRSSNSSSSQDSNESGYLTDVKNINNKKSSPTDWNNATVYSNSGFPELASPLTELKLPNPPMLQAHEVDQLLNLPKSFNRAPGSPVAYPNLFGRFNPNARSNM